MNSQSPPRKLYCLQMSRNSSPQKKRDSTSPQKRKSSRFNVMNKLPQNLIHKYTSLALNMHQRGLFNTPEAITVDFSHLWEVKFLQNKNGIAFECNGNYYYTKLWADLSISNKCAYYNPHKTGNDQFDYLNYPKELRPPFGGSISQWIKTIVDFNQQRCGIYHNLDITKLTCNCSRLILFSDKSKETQIIGKLISTFIDWLKFLATNPPSGCISNSQLSSKGETDSQNDEYDVVYIDSEEEKSVRYSQTLLKVVDNNRQSNVNNNKDSDNDTKSNEIEQLLEDSIPEPIGSLNSPISLFDDDDSEENYGSKENAVNATCVCKQIKRKFKHVDTRIDMNESNKKRQRQHNNEILFRKDIATAILWKYSNHYIREIDPHRYVHEDYFKLNTEICNRLEKDNPDKEDILEHILKMDYPLIKFKENKNEGVTQEDQSYFLKLPNADTVKRKLWTKIAELVREL